MKEWAVSTSSDTQGGSKLKEGSPPSTGPWLSVVGHQGLHTLWAKRAAVRLPKVVGTISDPSADTGFSSASGTSSRSEHRSSPGPGGLDNGDPGTPGGQLLLPGPPGSPARESPSRSRKLLPSRSGIDSSRWFRSSAETVASMAWHVDTNVCTSCMHWM